MIAPDALKTATQLTKAGLQTYKTIAARLAALNPPIYIDRHIAQNEQKGKTDFSSLESHESTLDGINFKAEDPKLLARIFENARDKWDNPALAGMKEDPGHWALKASFGKTIGTGYREIWREAPYQSPTVVQPESGNANNMFRMRFGTAGTPIRFTALHCAVHEIGGQCNVHIDESGFVLGMPGGKALTPDLYDHIMNELKFKTDFRDWLSGLMPNATAQRIVKEVVRRISITFPNAMNGYADLGRRVKSLHRPTGVVDTVKQVGNLLKPVGITVDAYENDYFKVQVTGTAAGGDRSIAISIGGEW